ncbi:MAG: hypothetical protein AB7F99_19195 [Vicinamibacterales bacterium]
MTFGVRVKSGPARVPIGSSACAAKYPGVDRWSGIDAAIDDLVDPNKADH